MSLILIFEFIHRSSPTVYARPGGLSHLRESGVHSTPYGILCALASSVAKRNVLDTSVLPAYHSGDRGLWQDS